ncbi:hypothetical protein CJ030_MR4G020686 [Morella rubra]|uniref:Uncharacterized protein n=1 Tax=Morella rubra TaxID=262757 RepID=A0A6A1VXH1_9ROSI|nr:hypothetical protein CJ030_MR4G020686 [Morella rubra]
MRHRAITCKNQILINNFFHDHFDLDYTRHEDVRTVVETMMTARRTHRNRMHAYFKKFPSKEAALLKPHPDTTEEQWKELCDLFTSEAFMKRSEQNKKNRSKLTVNHAAGSRSFQRTRACMERMDAFQRQCDLEGKTYTEIEREQLIPAPIAFFFLSMLHKDSSTYLILYAAGMLWTGETPEVRAL